MSHSIKLELSFLNTMRLINLVLNLTKMKGCPDGIRFRHRRN